MVIDISLSQSYAYITRNKAWNVAFKCKRQKHTRIGENIEYVNVNYMQVTPIF